MDEQDEIVAAAALGAQVWEVFRSRIDSPVAIEDVAIDGHVLKRNVRGRRAHWIARGGHVESSTITTADNFEIPRDTIGTHVYAVGVGPQGRRPLESEPPGMIQDAAEDLRVQFQERVGSLAQLTSPKDLTVVFFGRLLSKSYEDGEELHLVARIDMGAVALTDDD